MLAGRGLRVYGAAARLVIRDQRLTAFGSDFFPGIELPVTPQVSNVQAVDAILRDLSAAGPLKPVNEELIIYPQSAPGVVRYHLAWQVTMPERIERQVEEVPPASEVRAENVPVQWRYFVDASTGSIIERVNMTRYLLSVSGKVTGTVFPRKPTDTPITVEMPNIEVTLLPSGQRSEAVSDVTDEYGNYSFPIMWDRDSGTIEAYLAGPDIEVINGETPLLRTKHSALLSGFSSHAWNWSTDDPSPSDVETNAFYHAGKIRTWFAQKIPGVTPLPHPMRVEVRVPGLVCKGLANPEGIHFSKGVPGGCADFALCSEIVYHEFTHRIVRRIYDDAAISLLYLNQSGAMDEGWATYFGATNTGDPQFGRACGLNNLNIDVPDKRYPADFVADDSDYNQANGKIFAGAIWDLRRALGAQYIDDLALRAMRRATTSFGDYLGAFLEEDDDKAFSPSPLANDDLSDGTPNIDAICHVFYDLHGIYHDACAGHTEQPWATIASPDPRAFNLFDKSAPRIEFLGTAHEGASPLQSVVMEFGSGESPGTWSTAGIAVSGGGSARVVNDVLGIWDLSAVGDGLYTIRLTVTDTAGRSSSAVTSVVIDRLLETGWPNSNEAFFRAAPATVEIDGAYPGLEVVVISNNGLLHVFHADATEAAGWPRYVGPTESSPVVGDLDNDGNLEIVIVTGAQVHAFRSDGSPLAGWPTPFRGELWRIPTAALSDLDRDGDAEVVVGSSDGSVFVWHHDGTIMTGWPRQTGGAISSSPALADLDGDGDPEVVAGSNDKSVYAWHHRGASVTGWPQATGGAVDVSPVVGDVDGDGMNEVVAASDKMYVWNHDGTLATGWPVLYPKIRYPASVTLGDLDRDHVPEVLALGEQQNLHVLNGSGKALPGWPRRITTSALSASTSTTVGDIEGDGFPEVFAVSWENYHARVVALRSSGINVEGWPRWIRSNNSAGAALSDIDQDGGDELVVGSEGVSVWHLGSRNGVPVMQWPFYRHDVARTGAYVLRGRPDIAFSEMKADPPSASKNGSVGVSITLTNTGDIETGSFVVRFWKRATPPSANDVADYECSVADLRPQGTPATCGASFTFEHGGLNRVWAKADAAGAVLESNELDNLRSVLIPVYPLEVFRRPPIHLPWIDFPWWLLDMMMPP